MWYVCDAERLRVALRRVVPAFDILAPGTRWLHGTSRGGGRSRLRCRTESPQPVSSVRRRWSTDAMQLREVGKPAAYLWKMRWLQTPGDWARHLAPFVWLAIECALRTCVLLVMRCLWGTAGASARPNHDKWLARNCCCAGESDCLIETQLCDEISWLVPQSDFCPVL